MLLNKVTDSHAVSVLIMLRPYTKPGCAAHVHQHGLLQIAEVKALTRQRSVRCCSNATADPEVAERQAAHRTCEHRGQADSQTLIGHRGRVVLREWNTRLHQQCLQWQQDHVVAETEWLTSALQLSRWGPDVFRTCSCSPLDSICPAVSACYITMQLYACSGRHFGALTGQHVLDVTAWKHTT
jgi:hypothetical protein